MHHSGDGDQTSCWPADPHQRAADVAAWGLGRRPGVGPERVAELVATDPDPRVRVAALGALARRTPPGQHPAQPAVAAWRRALADRVGSVRVRACEVAPGLFGPDGSAAGGAVEAGAGGAVEAGAGGAVEAGAGGAVEAGAVEALVAALADAEPLVAEAAAFALGELTGVAAPTAVPALVRTAGEHVDPLVREAAVAALGALGDQAGLAAVLAACSDKPAVRRRAVLALAAFEGPEVEAALEAALSDRDWQVRQAAEDLLARPAEGSGSG